MPNDSRNELSGSNFDDSRAETQKWVDALGEVYLKAGSDGVRELLKELSRHVGSKGVKAPFSVNTPYINTIPPEEEPRYPGDPEIEDRIKSIIRWTAMAMVVRANREEEGIGGHISTYASIATLYEVGFNHFFRAKTQKHPGDLIYFQGHSSPGIYARSFLEGRIPLSSIDNFRHELHDKPGLASYPHPWLMPTFWNFPTVSMGLGPILAIYHARFIKYLEGRNLKTPSDQKIWAFLGDGETDEPEALGAISLASREQLDNLIFVINCNLQRLDGPVRGNGKIIQELETIFRGAGWNVIKVIWGKSWDPLLEKDVDGLLVKRMEEVLDGQYQKYLVESGEFIRKDFFGRDPRLLEMVKDLSDEEIRKLTRGGHDHEKVYAAYQKAMMPTGAPTVILTKTIKGYGLGAGGGGEGRNITHQQKKLNEQELRDFRTRFSIPVSDDDIDTVPFYKPTEESEEIRYLLKKRKTLGGFLPQRESMTTALNPPDEAFFQEFFEGTRGHAVSTTMAFVRLLSKLLKEKEIGRLIVPIVPDEARTFGMNPLFRQCGIYSHRGQLYEPVDSKNLLYYKEARDGQILEEGINEAGSLSSFVAAGTAYSNHGINMVPFFIFYSMFGFQRVGDLIWAAGDSRSKGFLVGATSGRTTLAGEGLQHQDGNSHLLAYPVPNLLTYDPAYAYEIAVIVQEGLRRMYQNGEDVFYYFTVTNENDPQPAMPENAKDGILKGIYRVGEQMKDEPLVHLFGSGAILKEVLKAQRLLKENHQVQASTWSVTSYKELYKNGIDTDRWNTLHSQSEPRIPYLTTVLSGSTAPVVAVTDYVKALPATVSSWIPGPFIALGTDGYGRSDGREALREFFEVNAEFIVLSALYQLMKAGRLDRSVVKEAERKYHVKPEKPNPLYA